MDIGFVLFLACLGLLGWICFRFLLEAIYYIYETLTKNKKKLINPEELEYWRNKARIYKKQLIDQDVTPKKKKKVTFKEEKE